MTVTELITRLQAFNPNVQVEIFFWDAGFVAGEIQNVQYNPVEGMGDGNTVFIGTL